MPLKSISESVSELQQVIRMGSALSIESARNPTELVLYAQSERLKAEECEKAARRLQYGGRPVMLHKVLAIFSQSSAIDSNVDRFSSEETAVLREALNLVKLAHLALAKEAEDRVSFTPKPEVGSGK
jgi:hypothetical protein